jgi:hypothetical protein
MKITVENQAILRRLQDKQPTYSAQQWQEEYKKNEMYRNNVIEYPYEFGDINSRTRFLLTTAQNDDASTRPGLTSSASMFGG